MIKTVKPRRAYNGALRKEQAQLTRGRILEAARRLLTSGTYSSVTMEDIAKEAGVAYQTVYGVFGNKLRLAQALIDVGFPHVSEALMLFEGVKDSADPEVWLRTGARVNRLIYELCADLLRFMRESGDPGLLTRYREREEQRLVGMNQVGLVAMLENSGRLRPGISATDAVAVIWSWSGPDHYTDLVFERGWTTSRYEQWLGDSMINTLLQPGAG
jgi:AcrR family transcriptional regulator